jgi:hypothetical protein
MMKIGPAVAAAAVFATASPVCAQDAVQWRVQDGGNGHWYRLRTNPGLRFEELISHAGELGGYLVSITSSAENAFVRAMSMGHNVHFGAFHDQSALDFSEPAGGWTWTSGETWGWTGWCGNQPDDASWQGFQGQEVARFNSSTSDCWDDAHSLIQLESITIEATVIEWSADCNGDGIVDYGQIRDGTFPDVNTNGVPDCCEPGESCTPCPGDVTNGGTVDAADLSILLAAWGTNGQGEFDTDLNGDGLVDGGDLALVLGGWGACP